MDKKGSRATQGISTTTGTVHEIMTSSVVTIGYNRTAASAAELMGEKGFGSLLVKRNGSVIGIVTERDLVRKVLATKRKANRITVKEIMSKPLVTVRPRTSVDEAAKLMADKRIRRVVVMDDEKLVGIVTITDIARYITKLKNHFSLLYPMITALTRQEPANSPYV